MMRAFKRQLLGAKTYRDLILPVIIVRSGLDFSTW